jgi:uncharacterized protein (TIGR02453 family)
MARRALPVDLGGIETPPFAGFGPDAFRFLEELAAHQSRDWFLANKARYESEVRSPLGALVVDLSAALAKRNIPLRGNPTTSLFRINRDVRFSKDKSLYKTHAGAVLSRDGRKMEPPILYIHIAAEECFTAAGFYHPEPDALAAIRRTIVDRPSVWRAIAAALDQAGLALSQDDKLVRSPKGFEGVDDPEIADALKLKSFVVRRDLTRQDVGHAALVADLAEFAESAAPLFRLA